MLVYVYKQVLGDVLQYMQIKPYPDENILNVVVPDITGLTLSAARRKLAGEGLELMDDGVSQTVLEQLPPPGSTLPTGGHVMAYTAASNAVTPETLVKTPDLLGLSDVDCARMARRRGLTLQLDGTGVCIRQTPAAGEYVPPGTVVNIILAEP
jgi:beta-lactam-binding protein with PASTA domain